MSRFSSWMWIILIVNNFAVVINGQDTKTVMFPSSGNGSAFELRSKIESTNRTGITANSESIVQPFAISPSYYAFAPRKTFVRQRSEGVPYIYEYPNIGYPVAHSIDHSVGLSSKHLVVVSFIGLLLLLAIIQNTITAIKRRDTLVDVLSTRQKRDVYDTRDLNSVTSEQEDVWNDDARLRCVQRTVCLENQKLFKYLGNIGKILAKYLTRGIEKSFKSSSGWDRLVDDAGAAGIRGDDCNVLYRDCDTPISSNRRHDPNESEQHENQLKHTYKKRRK